ncbi:hypothetical protein PHMEG_0005167 [Phytophthora megakarya]|uniref:Uncharacterized protein n=1 Tax=Phytophthora megakarya TaxID=4795 RepID=A0A225WS49_9STRA|nr:hypothetical protein PHMEG_0005167 [Phytophthora megakarya]
MPVLLCYVVHNCVAHGVAYMLHMVHAVARSTGWQSIIALLSTTVLGRQICNDKVGEISVHPLFDDATCTIIVGMVARDRMLSDTIIDVCARCIYQSVVNSYGSDSYSVVMGCPPPHDTGIKCCNYVVLPVHLSNIHWVSSLLISRTEWIHQRLHHISMKHCARDLL